MKRDQMVVITFRIARHSEDLETDPNADIEYGPCTKEEGDALCEIINTKYRTLPQELLRRLPGKFTSDLRSYLRDARACCAQVVPAFRYRASVSQAIDLLGRQNKIR